MLLVKTKFTSALSSANRKQRHVGSLTRDSHCVITRSNGALIIFQHVLNNFCVDEEARNRL